MDISPLLVPPEEQLARKFGYTYKELASLIYPTTNKSYERFTIPKKNGETRVINAPRLKLLRIQKILADDLTKIYTPKNCAHGFITNRSIVTNAEMHTGKRYVFNIDLKDFFGSIHFGRVRNLLMASPFGYTYNQATILAQICCHEGSIPQGAPTSPVISNIICWKMDAQLQRLAIENRCTYTRYADDITFSFSVSKAKLPRSILKINTATDEVSVSPILEKIIQDNGFIINNEKVRLQGRNQRQQVTGITVNNKLNLKRTFIRQTASMLHAWRKYGAVAAEKEYLEKYRLKNIKFWQVDAAEKGDGKFFIDVVGGRINFIQMVKGRDDPVYRKLAYQFTEALGIPNLNFIKSHHELSTFIIEDIISEQAGSGFLLENIGIVTNEHVLKLTGTNDIDFFKVFRCFEEDNKKVCRLIAASKALDLAILKPNKDHQNMKPYRIGNDRLIQTGTPVTVVGYPNYLEGAGATPITLEGRVTGRMKQFGVDAWLVDLPINHGCSGAPVFNEKGEVIGVAAFGPAHNDGLTVVNGFIPISDLNKLLEELKTRQDAA